MKKDDDDNLILSRDYIEKSYSIVADALKHGNEVLQMPNGDIFVTEIKEVTTHYKWDVNAKKMVRAKSASSYMKKKTTTDLKKKISGK